MTPLQIEILLHYSGNPQTDYSKRPGIVGTLHANSEAVHNALYLFRHEGILQRNTVRGFHAPRPLLRWAITEKGRAVVEQLKAAAPSVPHGLQTFNATKDLRDGVTMAADVQRDGVLFSRTLAADTAQRRNGEKPGSKFYGFVERLLQDLGGALPDVFAAQRDGVYADKFDRFADMQRFEQECIDMADALGVDRGTAKAVFDEMQASPDNYTLTDYMEKATERFLAKAQAAKVTADVRRRGVFHVHTPKGRVSFPELTPIDATKEAAKVIAKRAAWVERKIEKMPFDEHGFEVFMHLRDHLIENKYVTPARWRATFDIVMGRTRNLKNRPLAAAIYFKMEEANNGRELRRAALDTLSTTWSALSPGD